MSTSLSNYPQSPVLSQQTVAGPTLGNQQQQSPVETCGITVALTQTTHALGQTVQSDLRLTLFLCCWSEAQGKVSHPLPLHAE